MTPYNVHNDCNHASSVQNKTNRFVHVNCCLIFCSWLFQKPLGMEKLLPSQLEEAILNSRTSSTFTELLTKLLLTRSPEDKKLLQLIPKGQGLDYELLNTLLRIRLDQFIKAYQRYENRGAEEEEQSEESEVEDKRKNRFGRKRKREKPEEAAEIEELSQLDEPLDTRRMFNNVNPLSASTSFHDLSPSTQVRILLLLCEYHFQCSPDCSSYLRELPPSTARVIPLTSDTDGNQYFWFGFTDYRIYKQASQKKRNKADKEKKESKAAKPNGVSNGTSHGTKMFPIFNSKPKSSSHSDSDSDSEDELPLSATVNAPPSFTLITHTESELKQLIKTLKSTKRSG